MRHLTITTRMATAVAAIMAFAWILGADPINPVGWGPSRSHAQSKPQVRPTASQAAPAIRSAQVTSAAATPAPAVASAPMRTERIVYDSWTVTCTDTVEKASKKTCSAMLQVIEEKQRQVLLLWVIGRDNQGVLRTVFQSPTGVQIPRGLELKFGNAAARTVPYAACTPQNCEASLAVDDAMIRDARANGEATATIFAVDGRTINFKMGIKGIDKAFAALGK